MVVVDVVGGDGVVDIVDDDVSKLQRKRKQVQSSGKCERACAYLCMFLCVHICVSSVSAYKNIFAIVVVVVIFFCGYAGVHKYVH